MTQKPPNWSSRGHSLPELLVVMVILGLVSSGIYAVFNTGQLTVAKQQDNFALEQQGRQAMRNLERDLRTICYGYADVGNLRINVSPPTGPAPTTWGFAESFDNLSSATVARRTDSIQFRYSLAPADQAADTYVTQDNLTAGNDTLVNSVDGFQQGDLFIIYDPRDTARPATLLQVSNDPSHGTKDRLVHNRGSNGPYNPPNSPELFPAGGYTTGSKVLNLAGGRTIHYYIDKKLNLVRETRDNFDLSLPATSLRPVAAGVEDLQIKYCFKDGQWLDGIVAGDASHDVNNLRALRVSIIVRSLRPARTSSGISSALTLTGDLGNGIPRGGDRYRRMTLTTVINLRNLALRG